MLAIKTKKSPDHFTDPGIPDFPTETNCIPYHGDQLSIRFKAGLLTSGLSYSPRLPSYITQPVAFRDFRPRLQRRARCRFSRHSLFRRLSIQTACHFELFYKFIRPFSKTSARECQGIKMCSPENSQNKHPIASPEIFCDHQGSICRLRRCRFSSFAFFV